MNKERSLLAIIIASVALVVLLGMCGCSSTKKSVNKLAEEFEKSGWLKTDSTKSVKKDSSAVSSSTTTTKEVVDSGYEKETDETIIEWINMGDTATVYKSDTIPAKTKVVFTKKKIKEKGNRNSAKVTESSRTDSTSLKGSDSANVKKDSADASSGTKETFTKDIQKKKAWQIAFGILAILAVSGAVGYFTKAPWFFAVFPKRKKSDNET